MIRKILLWLFGSAILVAVIGSYWMSRDSKAKLDEIQGRLRSAGAPMTIEEMLPDAVADELNAAPLYGPLDELMASTGFRDDLFTKLIDISETEIEPKDIYCLRISESDWEVINEILDDERLQAVDDQIKRITSRAYFQPDWKYEEGPSMLIPEIGISRKAAEYLLIRAAQALRTNDFAMANERLNQVLTLSTHCEQGPCLISYLAGTAIRGMASRFLEVATLTSKEKFDYDPSVWVHRSHDQWQAPLDSERLGMGKVVFESFINGDAEMFEKISGEPAPKKFYATRLSPLASYLRYDYIHYLTFMEAERQSEGTYYIELVERSKALEERIFPSERKRYAHILSSIITPALLKVREAVFKSDAQNVINHTALKLLQYHREKGDYPGSLDRLVPDYCESIPMDLFNGEPLIYRRAPSGFALYSVGPNFEDDGGVTDHRGSASDDFGDLIWAGFGSSLSRTEEY